MVGVLSKTLLWASDFPVVRCNTIDKESQTPSFLSPQTTVAVPFSLQNCLFAIRRLHPLGSHFGLVYPIQQRGDVAVLPVCFRRTMRRCSAARRGRLQPLMPAQ